MWGDGFGVTVVAEREGAAMHVWKNCYEFISLPCYSSLLPWIEGAPIIHMLLIGLLLQPAEVI